MLRIAMVGALVLGALGCAGAPRPAPDQSGVFGQVRLVPREGASGGGAGAYGDRRLRDVALVDYTRTGYAVVYATGSPQRGSAELAIADGVVGARIEPPLAAVGLGGALVVRNAGSRARIVSVPDASRVENLAPGTALRIVATQPGALRVFLLDEPDVEAVVFVAPGPHAVTTETGQYELLGLAPGPNQIHVWHPRFPPAQHAVALVAGAAQRVDFALSAQDRPAEGTDAAR